MNKRELHLKSILRQIPEEYNITLNTISNAWVDIVGERIGGNRHHVAKYLDISLTKYRRLLDSGLVKNIKPCPVGRPKSNFKT